MQLPLDLRLSDDATFENFIIGDHQNCVNWLRSLVLQRSTCFKYGYLFGPPGSGRRHLLWATCHLAEKQGLRVAYIPLERLIATEGSILEGIEQLDLCCLAGIEDIVGSINAEEALFHAFNRCMDAQKRLLVTGQTAPVYLELRLLDLRSRLGGGVSFALKPLSEEQRVEALEIRARERGLVLPRAVGAFLLKRWPRSMRELLFALQQLDNASLAQKRALTIPFVKTVLNI